MARILVPVLVHVLQGNLCSSQQFSAVCPMIVSVEYKVFLRHSALRCSIVQNAINQTQNPPIARSWGFAPPSRHQTIIFKTSNLHDSKTLRT